MHSSRLQPSMSYTCQGSGTKILRGRNEEDHALSGYGRVCQGKWQGKQKEAGHKSSRQRVETRHTGKFISKACLLHSNKLEELHSKNQQTPTPNNTSLPIYPRNKVIHETQSRSPSNVSRVDGVGAQPALQVVPSSFGSHRRPFRCL